MNKEIIVAPQCFPYYFYKSPNKILKIIIALLILLLCSSCSTEIKKEAKHNETAGGLSGKLVPEKSGAKVVLCKLENAGANFSCTLQSELTDMTNSDGSFAISMIPPGKYIACYAYSNDVPNLKIHNEDKIPFDFELKAISGASMQLQNDNGKILFKLKSDVSTYYYTISKGARIDTKGSTNESANLLHANIKHKGTGLWVEIRNNTFVEFFIESNKTTAVTINSIAE